jgi:hypothetical protein
MHSPWQQRLAWVLSFFLLVLSLAVYTPLHVHGNGNPGQCSLNSFEHQWSDSVAPHIELPQPSGPCAVGLAGLPLSRPSLIARPGVPARAPPAA